MIPRSLLLLIVSLCLPYRISAQPVLGADPRASLQSEIRTTEQPSTANAADSNSIARSVNAALHIIPNDPDSAERVFTNALEQSRRLNYNTGIAACLTNLGWLKNISGDHEAAIAYYRAAEPYALKGFGNRTSLAMFYNSMASPYFSRSLFDSMYIYISQAEQIVSGIQCKTTGEVKDVSSIYNSIGLLWAAMGDYKRGLAYLHRCRAVIDGFRGDKSTLNTEEAFIRANIGMAHLELNNPDSAKYYLLNAYATDPGNPVTLLGLGELRALEQDKAGAAMFLTEALRRAEQAHDYINIITANAALGKLHFNDGDYATAKPYLQKVLQLSGNKGNHDVEHTYKAYEQLAAIAAKEGNFKAAYELEQNSLKLLDSIKVKEKLFSAYTLESQLRQATWAKHKAKQEMLLQQTRNRYTLWLVGGAAVLLLLAAWFIIWYRNSSIKQRMQQKELDAVTQEQEIKTLQSMIKGEEKERTRMAREIHDGIMVQFSTIKMKLKSVPDSYRDLRCAEYLDTEYYRQLVDQMEDATRDLRSTAHNLMPDMLLQDGLEDAVLYFCNNLKKNTNIDIEFQKHGQIPPLNKEFELAVYRIIQELLQNAMKHAQASHILVQLAMLSDDLLTLTIEDNGKGFDVDKDIKGLGLASIRNRLKVMNGYIDIHSRQGQGTSVHIEFENLIYSPVINDEN
jgi:two-component system NarL family sensor kinase